MVPSDLEEENSDLEREPRVDFDLKTEEASSISSPLCPSFRLLKLGKKKLPDVETHDCFWGDVERVGDSLEELEKEMSSSTYDTATLGMVRIGFPCIKLGDSCGKLLFLLNQFFFSLLFFVFRF